LIDSSSWDVNLWIWSLEQQENFKLGQISRTIFGDKVAVKEESGSISGKKLLSMSVLHGLVTITPFFVIFTWYTEHENDEERLKKSNMETISFV
jgi:hypothetical protein